VAERAHTFALCFFGTSKKSLLLHLEKGEWKIISLTLADLSRVN